MQSQVCTNIVHVTVNNIVRSSTTQESRSFLNLLCGYAENLLNIHHAEKPLNIYHAEKLLNIRHAEKLLNMWLQ